MDAWNFPGFLKHSMKQEIITIANEAKGPFFSMKEYLAGEFFNDDSLDVVIWEFPVRTILKQSAKNKD